MPIAHSSYAARPARSQQQAQFTIVFHEMRRKHVLPHSFQVIASRAGTSNDSNSEAVCFNNGNLKSLQVQNLLGVFFLPFT